MTVLPDHRPSTISFHIPSMASIIEKYKKLGEEGRRPQQIPWVSQEVLSWPEVDLVIYFFPYGGPEQPNEGGGLGIYMHGTIKADGLEAVTIPSGWSAEILDESGLQLITTAMPFDSRFRRGANDVIWGKSGIVKCTDLPEQITIRVRGLALSRWEYKPGYPREPPGQPLRVYTEAELLELSSGELTRLRDAVLKAVERKPLYDEDRCGVCWERDKSYACVPCGHRYCGECISRLQECGSCRQHVTSTLKLF